MMASEGTSFAIPQPLTTRPYGTLGLLLLRALALWHDHRPMRIVLIVLYTVRYSTRVFQTLTRQHADMPHADCGHGNASMSHRIRLSHECHLYDVHFTY